MFSKQKIVNFRLGFIPFWGFYLVFYLDEAVTQTKGYEILY